MNWIHTGSVGRCLDESGQPPLTLNAVADLDR